MANYRGGRINEEVKREISIIIRDEILNRNQYLGDFYKYW